MIVIPSIAIAIPSITIIIVIAALFLSKLTHHNWMTYRAIQVG